MYQSFTVARLSEKSRPSGKAIRFQSGSKRHVGASRNSQGEVAMVDQKGGPKSRIAHILQRLSEILPQSEVEEMGNASATGESFEIYAAPEEGQRLIRVFMRIKRPELRAALIKVAARMVDVKD
jgi:hypothetical protein